MARRRPKEDDAMRWRILGTGVSLISALALAACSSGDPSPDVGPATAKAPDSSGVSPRDLGSEPQAADYCGILSELRHRADVMSGMPADEQLAAVGVNLDYVAKATALLRTEDPDRADAWAASESAYSATADFFAVSGAQIANGDFLVLLADAVSSSDSAYTATRERAMLECGVDVAALITPQR
jgi:hypothetical protein